MTIILSRSMKNFKKILTFLVMSFAGGFSAIVFLSYFGKTKSLVPTADQAVSIANTYIVFTTYIFVAFTVLLTIVCYVLAQNFSTHTKTLHNETVENIRDCINSDDEKAEKILSAMLSSPLIQKHLSERLGNLIDRELSARMSERQEMGAKQLAEVDEMRGWVQGNRRSRGNEGRSGSFQGPMNRDAVDEFRNRNSAGVRDSRSNDRR